MASKSGRTADLTNQNLVAMFRDERRAVRLDDIAGARQSRAGEASTGR
jgi:hypothetical protein